MSVNEALDAYDRLGSKVVAVKSQIHAGGRGKGTMYNPENREEVMQGGVKIAFSREEVETYSPYRCIRIESCEADDVIATIIEAKNDPSPTVIVSPDKDFVQLQKYPNVKQFSNIQKKG